MRESLIVIGLLVLAVALRSARGTCLRKLGCAHVSRRQLLRVLFPERQPAGRLAGSRDVAVPAVDRTAHPHPPHAPAGGQPADAPPGAESLVFPERHRGRRGDGGGRLRACLGLRLGMGRHAPVFPALLAPRGTRRGRRLPVRAERCRVRLHFSHLPRLRGTRLAHHQFPLRAHAALPART